MFGQNSYVRFVIPNPQGLLVIVAESPIEKVWELNAKFGNVELVG